jgi:hypothetical protein
VKQFAAESPQPHLAQLNALAKLMAREFDLPDSGLRPDRHGEPDVGGRTTRQGRDS